MLGLFSIIKCYPLLIFPFLFLPTLIQFFHKMDQIKIYLIYPLDPFTLLYQNYGLFVLLLLLDPILELHLGDL